MEVLDTIFQQPAVAWAALASMVLFGVRVRRQLKEDILRLPDTEREEQLKEAQRFDSNVKYLAEVEHAHVIASLTPESSLGKRYGQRRIKRSMHKKLVVAMVGLPARGKSYIVKMLLRYMRFCKGVEGRLFNVGDYRRKHGLAGVGSKFFDKNNEEAMKARENMATAVLGEAIEWLEADDNNRVAIFDATNTTIHRREMIKTQVGKVPMLGVMFIESICNDPETLDRNYRLKLQNADYKGRDREQALHDFLERVRAYEAVYEPIEDYEATGRTSYIKIYNVGNKVTTRNCAGYLQSCMSYYLQNIHIIPRRIWLVLPSKRTAPPDDVPPTERRLRLLHSIADLQRPASPIRHRGETEYPPPPPPEEVTKEGRQFALDLCRFVASEISGDAQHADFDPECVVMASPDAAAQATVEHLTFVCNVQETALLRTLHHGDLTGWTQGRLKTLPGAARVLAAQEADPLGFRYPGAGGESYLDVIQRLEPLMVELERQRRDVVVVAAKEVAQCIYGYFMGYTREEVPHVQLNQHVVYQLTPGPFSTVEDIIDPRAFF